MTDLHFNYLRWTPSGDYTCSQRPVDSSMEINTGGGREEAMSRTACKVSIFTELSTRKRRENGATLVQKPSAIYLYMYLYLATYIIAHQCWRRPESNNINALMTYSI